MLKLFSHRLSIYVKMLLLFLGVCATLYYSAVYLLDEVAIIVLRDYNVHVDFLEVLSQVSVRPLTIAFPIVLLLFLWVTVDIIFFRKRLNHEIKESLDERGMTTNFSHLYSSLNFHQIITHLKDVFNLYKMFDNLKTSRIVLEVATIRQIMSHVSQGVILVRNDFVVTHINHVAEGYLGLISGEIINQCISRQLDQPHVLDALEKAFEFDKRVVDIPLEKENVSLSIFPLKDKFGEVIRVLLVLDKVAAPKKSKK